MTPSGLFGRGVLWLPISYGTEVQGLRHSRCRRWIGRLNFYLGMERAIYTDHRVCGNLERCEKRSKEVAGSHGDDVR